MTSEPVVGVDFGRLVVGKTILSYIYLPFHSATQASQLTGTSSYYRFRCHYPLITPYLNWEYCFLKTREIVNLPWLWCQMRNGCLFNKDWFASFWLLKLSKFKKNIWVILSCFHCKIVFFLLNRTSSQFLTTNYEFSWISQLSNLR